MRAVQGTAEKIDGLIELAGSIGATEIALPLGSPKGAVDRVLEAGLEWAGWYQAARDPQAAKDHPKWMHAPQHGEWLKRFPDFKGRHPALVAPYIGLGTRPAADHALLKFRSQELPKRVYLADIQGPPMGCGCGNPSCRSWDNAPGEKVAPSAYECPDVLFSLEFFRRCRAVAPEVDLVPVLCAECERGIGLEAVWDPDGPDGTGLCKGVGCVSPCSTEFWPRLLAAFRKECDEVALVLTVDALEKDHKVFGPPRAWAKLAHRHYGEDLLPAIEPEDIRQFHNFLVVTDYDQTCWPTKPPEGDVPSVPPICCPS